MSECVVRHVTGNVRRHLPGELFTAYIQGGMIWPQVRGGINLALLSCLTKSPEMKQLSSFAQTILSKRQVERSYDLMTQAHERAGIFLKISSPDYVMQREWTKAKTAALASLYSFATQHNPLQIHTQWTREAEQLSHVPEITFSDEQISMLEQMCHKASQVGLAELLSLAKLYKLSLYAPQTRQIAYDSSRTKYDEIAKEYAIVRGESFSGVQGQILERVTKILQQRLQTEFKVPCSWITWGFGSSAYV